MVLNHTISMQSWISIRLLKGCLQGHKKNYSSQHCWFIVWFMSLWDMNDQINYLPLFLKSLICSFLFFPELLLEGIQSLFHLLFQINSLFLQQFYLCKVPIHSFSIVRCFGRRFFLDIFIFDFRWVYFIYFVFSPFTC